MARRTKKTPTAPGPASESDEARATEAGAAGDAPAETERATDAPIEDAVVVSEARADGAPVEEGASDDASAPKPSDDPAPGAAPEGEVTPAPPVDPASDDGALDDAARDDPASGEAPSGDAPTENASADARPATAIPDVPRGDGVVLADDTGDATGDARASSDAPEAEDDRRSEAPGAGAPVVPPPPRVIEKRGSGFVPLLLGGLLAGAIGYAIPTFTADDPVEAVELVDPARVTALEADLAALDARVVEPVEPAPPVDISPLEAAQADLTARLDALEAELLARPAAGDAAPAAAAAAASTAGLGDDTRLDALRADLAALREDVATDATGLRDELSTGAAALRDDLSAEIAALRDDLSAVDDRLSGLDIPDLAPVRDRLGGLSEEVAAIDLAPIAERVDAVSGRLDEVAAVVDDLRARAESNADDAAAVAREAARRELQLAVATGVPYAEPLAQLPDTPEVLEAFANTGVSTEAELIEAFPPLAREALRAARADVTADGGLASLAGRFLNSRSLEPREGGDPDAVLSRVEAAVREGRIDDALEEVDALPDAARAPLESWISLAEGRRVVEAALNEYLQDG